MVTTRAFQDPFGATTSTSSPAFAPRSALPSGESGETPPTLEISIVIRSPFSSSTSTVEPIPTSPLADGSFSTSTERWSRSRIVLIRCSSSPCSFFAAWYSKFSDRSPKSRAVAIASTASARAGPLQHCELRLELLFLGGRHRLGLLVGHCWRVQPIVWFVPGAHKPSRGATICATSRSSRTSTTARRRSSTRCSGSPARSARTRTSPSASWTRWTSSARRASRSSPRTRRSRSARRRSTSSTRPATPTSAARSSAA